MPKFVKTIIIERVYGLEYPCTCCTEELAVIRYIFTRPKRNPITIDLCLDHLRLFKTLNGSASRLKPKVKYGKGKPIRTMDELMVALNQRSIWLNEGWRPRCVASNFFKNKSFVLVATMLKENLLYYRIPIIDHGVSGKEGK